MGDIVEFKKPKNVYTYEDSLNHLNDAPKGFAIMDRDLNKDNAFQDIVQETKGSQERYESRLCAFMIEEYDRVQDMPIDVQVYFNKMFNRLTEAQLKDME